jgi:DNA-binding NtrC family response regulator
MDTATSIFRSLSLVDMEGAPADETLPRDGQRPGALGPERATPAARAGASVVTATLGALHPRMASSSPAMDEVFTVMGRLAPTDVTVTLTGETGTGKDVFAHLLHDTSPRAGRPFVVFDCGAVPPNLVESELFGHERGSFTGAHSEHLGAFERAHGGTLFLDEIGELPMELQPRLLRVLDNRVVRRVGGTKDRLIDVRIVAATNRDLSALTTTKQFRPDLYFRLAAASVHLPPLRERLEDLPLLVPRLMRDLGRPDVIVSRETLEVLREHAWPGNVRELKNTLACAAAFVDGCVLDPKHLRISKAPVPASRLDALPLGGHSLESIERVAIRQTVLQSGGNKVHAARALGIAPSTLYEKLKRYGL